MMVRVAVLTGLLAAAGLACGEPPVDVDIPARGVRTHVADLAGILDVDRLTGSLEPAAADGLDIVVLTFETPQASCGEAFRAGAEFVDAWDGDVAVVAVARPGDFASEGDDRQRCLGVHPRDERDVPGAVRERIAEELVPPLAAKNQWTAAVQAAIHELAGR